MKSIIVSSRTLLIDDGPYGCRTYDVPPDVVSEIGRIESRVEELEAERTRISKILKAPVPPIEILSRIAGVISQ